MNTREEKTILIKQCTFMMQLILSNSNCIATGILRCNLLLFLGALVPLFLLYLKPLNCLVACQCLPIVLGFNPSPALCPNLFEEAFQNGV